MFDIIIKNGNIVDGTGAKTFNADVGIKEDKIEKIGDLSNEESEKVIDASGKIVCPGFIDVNNHSDTYWRIFINPDLESLVYQGVTTIIGGMCGSSLAPLTGPDIIKSVQKWINVSNLNIDWLSVKELFETLEKRELSVNFGMLVGHGTIRRGLIGDQMRNLTHDELGAAKKMLSRALDEGALGMSSGLIYTHAKTASEEELVMLAQEIAKRKKVYASHIRGESEELLTAVEEAINIAQKTKVSLQISHLKAMGKKNWSLIKDAVAQIEHASETGININFDVYPYASTGSVLYTLLPDWVAEGGRKSLIARLKDDDIREKIIQEMKKSPEYDYSKVYIAASPLNKTLIKRKVTEIAASQGKEVEEAIIDILIASNGHVLTNMKVLNEKDVRQLAKSPLAMIASNGSGYNMDHSQTGEIVHPRCFGSFSRFIGTFVREGKLLSLEDAIRKITSLPAEKFGIDKRGKIAAGFFADLAIFDYDKVSGPATEENPYQYSKGIEWLLTNGGITVKNGKYTGNKKGEVIKR